MTNIVAEKNGSGTTGLLSCGAFIDRCHQEELEKSAISQELINLNFLSVDRDGLIEFVIGDKLESLGNGKVTPHSQQYVTQEVSRFLEWYTEIDGGGWLFQGCDPLTGKPLGWGCAKPDNPRPKRDSEGRIKTNADGSIKPQKYEHPARVDQGIFFCNLEDNADWKAAHEHKVDLVITEGAKKTAAIQSVGYFAAGISGISSGYRKTDTGHILHPLLEPWATQGRTIVLALDQDDPTDTDLIWTGKLARLRMGQLYMAAGCRVLVAQWDHADGKGIDDLIYNLLSDPAIEDPCGRIHSILFETATPFKKWAEPVEKEAKRKQDAWNARQMRQGGPVSPDFEVQLTYQEEALQDLFNHGGRYLALGQNLYKFNGTHYELLDSGEQKIKIREWASRYVVFEKGKYKCPYMKSTCINSIWEWVLLSFQVNPDRVNPPGLNLANGVLRINWKGRTPTWEMHPHSPEDLYLYCSPARYNPDADPSQVKRLLECLEPAPRTALLRTLACGLDFARTRKLHSRGVRAAILRGAGSNGKDSLRQVTMLLFQDALVSVDLSDFREYDNGRKYYLADLQGAKVNWSSENNKGTSLDGLDSLNVAITGDAKSLKNEQKNIQHTTFTAQCSHLFNVNRLPSIRTGLDSILSRFCIIDFNKTFKAKPIAERGELQADPRFKEDDQFLIDEVCPAFLNILLQELVNFAKFGIDYDSISESLEDIQEESTHLWQFVKDEGIVPSADGAIYINDLWKRLEDWYQDTDALEIVEDGGKLKRVWHEQAVRWDTNVTGPNQIYKRFKQLFPKLKKVRDTTSENKGRFFLQGITFASLLHSPDSTDVSASPSASLLLHQEPICFTSTGTKNQGATPENLSSEAKSEADLENGEAETRSQSGSEAVKQKIDPTVTFTPDGSGGAKSTPLIEGTVHPDTTLYFKGSRFPFKSWCSDWLNSVGPDRTDRDAAIATVKQAGSMPWRNLDIWVRESIYLKGKLSKDGQRLKISHHLMGHTFVIDAHHFQPRS